MEPPRHPKERYDTVTAEIEGIGYLTFAQNRWSASSLLGPAVDELITVLELPGFKTSLVGLREEFTKGDSISEQFFKALYYIFGIKGTEILVVRRLLNTDDQTEDKFPTEPTTRECPNCRIEHPLNLCAQILEGTSVDKVVSFHRGIAKGGFIEMRLEQKMVHIQATDRSTVDDLADRWYKLETTPWTLPVRLHVSPPTFRLEIKSGVISSSLLLRFFHKFLRKIHQGYWYEIYGNFPSLDANARENVVRVLRRLKTNHNIQEIRWFRSSDSPVGLDFKDGNWRAFSQSPEILEKIVKLWEVLVGTGCAIVYSTTIQMQRVLPRDRLQPKIMQYFQTLTLDKSSSHLDQSDHSLYLNFLGGGFVHVGLDGWIQVESPNSRQVQEAVRLWRDIE